MAKNSPSVPSIPDPTATAVAQSGANVNTAAAQSALNNVNTVTPYGSTTYEMSGTYTTPDGQVVPRYTQTTALNPLAQAILTGQQTSAANLVPGAEALSNTVGGAINTPLNFNTAFSPTLNMSPQQINDQAANAIYNKQASFLDPQWQQQTQQLQDQLSRQGIPVGSDAYNNAMKQLDNAKTQAYQAAQDSAVAGGSAAAGNLFNLALAGQQQNLNQQQLAQTNGLDLLSKLFGTSATQQQPITSAPQANVAPTDVIGATNAATQAGMNQYQAQLAANNATFGGLASLGGSAIRAFGPSLFG